MRRDEQLDNLTADLAAMKSESLQHHHAWMSEMELRKDAERQLREMGEHAAALRGALLRYGDHSPNCPGRTGPVSETCACGWMDNRNRVPGNQEETAVDQVRHLRELLGWIKRNHNGYPEGHSLCGVCKAIDKELPETRCPHIHPFGRCERESGHTGMCATSQIRGTDWRCQSMAPDNKFGCQKEKGHPGCHRYCNHQEMEW